MTLFIRLLFETLLGAILFWLILCWWFLPGSMRMDIPLAHPSTFIKIVATIAVLPYLLWSVAMAERLATLLPEARRALIYRAIRFGVATMDLVAALIFLRLLSPLVGIEAPPPEMVALLILPLMIGSWVRILRKGFAATVRVKDTSDPRRRLAGPLADELMATDRRPPILYLRSFGPEAWRSSVFGRFNYLRSLRSPRGIYFTARAPTSPMPNRREQTRLLMGAQRSVIDEQMIFGEFFSSLGPYIAIGRPGETFESMDLGAAKLFVEDHQWRGKVIELIESSAAIVLEAGFSRGLTWEIGQVASHALPRKLLLVLPRTPAEYRKFYDFAAPLFPRRLPYHMPESRLLMFADDWAPVPLDNPTFILADALDEFCEINRLVEAETEAREPVVRGHLHSVS